MKSDAAITYYVERLSNTRSWNPTERVAVASRAAGIAMLNAMAERFECGVLTSDSRDLPATMHVNYPQPYFPREVEAAKLWEAKDPRWRDAL